MIFLYRGVLHRPMPGRSRQNKVKRLIHTKMIISRITTWNIDTLTVEMMGMADVMCMRKIDLICL